MTPQDVANASNEYREEMNELKDWADECLMFHSTLAESTSRLVASYEDWCARHRKIPVKAGRWGKLMRKLGVEPAGGEERTWKGCRLVDKDPVQPS